MSIPAIIPSAINGPWFARARFVSTRDGGFGDIAIVQPDHGNEEHIARLIAAAPDLYEALKAMFDRWEPDPEPYADRRMWEAARDALNKAEGR